MSITHRLDATRWVTLTYGHAPGNAYILIDRIVAWYPLFYGPGTYIQTIEKHGVHVKESPDEVAEAINKAAG